MIVILVVVVVVIAVGGNVRGSGSVSGSGSVTWDTMPVSKYAIKQAFRPRLCLEILSTRHGRVLSFWVLPRRVFLRHCPLNRRVTLTFWLPHTHVPAGPDTSPPPASEFVKNPIMGK